MTLGLPTEFSKLCSEVGMLPETKIKIHLLNVFSFYSKNNNRIFYNNRKICDQHE